MQASLNSIKKLCIIAGQGQLPKLIADHCIANNIPYHFLLIKGQAKAELYKNMPHNWFSIGEVGRVLLTLEQQEVTHIIFGGAVKKPNFTDIKVDLKGAHLLANLTKSKFVGDNNVLTQVVNFIENYNYKVIGINDLGISSLLAEKGIIGKIKPSKADLLDIELGIEAATLLGKLDIGQAVIVENKNILALEAAEGTDELIKRTMKLKKLPIQAGTLVKKVKLKQDHRIDLPSIGEKTILFVSKAKLKGIAISNNSALIINKEKTVKMADKLNIFIYGF